MVVFFFTGDIVGLDIQKDEKEKKTQKNQSSFFFFFCAFCLTPFEREMKTNDRAKKKERRRTGRLRAITTRKTINAKVNNRKTISGAHAFVV
jgi:hypothetical protein